MEDEKDNKQKMGERTYDAFFDVPIPITIDGEKYYYLYDGLGSVTELIDEDENVVNRYRYTPFGEPIVKIEGVFNPYQYTGRRFDNETGQYYYRARMYSPVQGRFLSNDPMGMVDGPNMYMYVRNDPVNFRDPSGRWNPGWGNPMLINGAAGGGSLDCPYGSYPTLSECYRAYRDAGFSRRESLAYCLGDCTNPDQTPPGEGWGGLPNPPSGAEFDFIQMKAFGVPYGWKIICNEIATKHITLSWCTASSAVAIGSFLAALAGATAGVGAIIGGIAITAICAMATLCAYYNQNLVFYHVYGTGVPAMWCEGG